MSKIQILLPVWIWLHELRVYELVLRLVCLVCKIQIGNVTKSKFQVNTNCKSYKNGFLKSVLNLTIKQLQ